MPAELEGHDVLEFCPLPPGGAVKSKRDEKPATLHQMFEARFEQYKRTVVAPFFKDYFTRANAQVVLIDLFKILKAGLASHNDHRLCIEDIIAAFRYGAANWLTRNVLQRLGWPVTIERTVLVATKADHASPNQHANLAHLMRDLVTTAELHATGVSGDARIMTMIVSSMRSTEAVEGVSEVDGQKLTGLRGVVLGQEADGEQSVFPGEVPPVFPEDEWDTSAYHFPSFQVKGFPRKHGMAVKHINLDAVLGCIMEG
ncbi:MAG: YcjX family protein, partial [bacterium]|nr:YcjX family protein [bacterium]